MRICFFARPNSAPTVEVRISGYRQALAAHGSDAVACVRQGDPEDVNLIRAILKRDHPDAFLCANDLTAGQLMHTLMDLGKRIPDDVKMVGFDDVKYARLLPVPLTTIHQPCHNLGKIALSVMLERIAHPDLPTRDVLLSCDLAVRKSCGATRRRD
jgi:GntR family transcriptional regulator, arabinose operon transcriptional repressor